MSERELVIYMERDSLSHEVRKCAYKHVIEHDFLSIKKDYLNKSFESLILPINPSRDTIFHIAAYMGSVESLQLLFDSVPGSKKGDVLKKTNIYGNTLVHELAAARKEKIIKEEEKKKKKRAHQEATAADNALKFLKDNARSITPDILGMRNHKGETPLYRAAARGNKEIVKWLVKEVGDNLCDHYRRSSDDLPILHVAVMKEEFEVALWLLNKCPEIAELKNREDKTCLHLLATMPTAFKSSSSKMEEFETIVYTLIPDHLISKDIAEQGVQIDSSNPPKPNETTNSMPGYKICFSKFCDWLKDWLRIRRMRELKKKHCLARELVNKLVKSDGDFSWSESNKTNESSDEMDCYLKYDGEAAEEDEKDSKRQKYRGGAPMASDTPLITAAWSGIKEIVDAILDEYPQAIEHVTEKGQNILHVAVLNRDREIFDLIKNHPLKSRLVLGIDNEGDTVLHKAGYITYYTGGTKPTLALNFEEEVKWFQDIKELCPVHYTIYRNKNKFTADELFKKEHGNILKETQEWVKNACQSCSTVAILIATVLYAVAFQVPGGFNSGPDQGGHPILESNWLYSFFLVMDVAGLSTSLTAVLIFLSILTSSLDADSFLSSIPNKLRLGYIFLFISCVTSMLSFLATILLTVTLKTPGTTVLNFIAALAPITIYWFLQNDLSIIYPLVESILVKIIT